ncbi:hypothetical protein ACF07L_05415 [Streptomyces anulatus]|uniref:hypothetical protein n=1 Tax=Streptomyces anulatus TaxID=1892 RepID=UPI0036F5E3B7
MAGIVAVAVVAHLVVSAAPETPFVNASWDQQWAVFNHPATRMLDFVLGIVMARILQTGRWIRIPLWVIIFGPIGRAERTWPLLQALGMIALTYVLSIAVAWVLCHCFERPVSRRIGKSRPRTPVGAQRPGPADGPADGPALEPTADLKN